jgi:hypothetical protein
LIFYHFEDSTMRKAMMIVAIGMMFASVGCQSDKKPTTQDTMKMSAMKDDCPMCPGIQHAKPDGTCPECGMKVKG